jgi:mRNA interferase RelE/StbE
LAFKVSLKKGALKELANLDKRDARRILDKLGSVLPERADTFPVLHGDFAGHRKFRIGNYRVIFALSGNEALVLRIAHRKDAYRTDLD